MRRRYSQLRAALSARLTGASLLILCLAAAVPVLSGVGPTGSLTTARGVHTATLLANGKVLVAGGQGTGGYLASAELFDPVAGTSNMHVYFFGSVL